MTWYVEVNVSKRADMLNLIESLLIKGFSDRVEYCKGGWQDMVVANVRSHLKFDCEDDAIAFGLATGSAVHTSIPIVHTADYHKFLES